MTNIAEQTLATIVLDNSRAVSVFEKHDLDYCCKGKRTLSAACVEKGMDVDNIIKELDGLSAPEQVSHLPFSEMNAEQLMSYILIHHHFYVKQSIPTISNHLEKVVAKHGHAFNYMVRVKQLFSEVAAEMISHMQKEETILFPRIKELETLIDKDLPFSFPGGYIDGPINQMEAEHDHAGNKLYEIRDLTNNYTPPSEACTTFKLALSELKEFEDDLHRHVHLENNLLFPLSQKMLGSEKIKQS